MVRIDFPADSLDRYSLPATNYDYSGNGLIDVLVAWNDAESGIDPATARIEILGEIDGPAESGADLTAVWHELDRSGQGLVFEETYEQLVRHGTPRLVVSVEDSAGNRGADTLLMHVRRVDAHRTIDLGYEPGAASTDMVVCEDDGRLYLLRAYAVMVFEGETLQPVGTFPGVLPEPPARALCIPGDPFLYATVFVERFNRETLSWESRIPGTLLSRGIARSRLDPDIIWVGEYGYGVPVRVDRTIPEKIGEAGFPASTFYPDFSWAIALLDEDRKIYFSRRSEGGLVVGDPATGEVLARIDLSPGSTTPASTGNMVVGPDDRFVYAAVGRREPGIAEIDTETDVLTRQLFSGEGDGLDIALSPDGELLWLTVRDDFSGRSHSLLVDRERMEQIDSFAHPDPDPDAIHWALMPAVFDPGGKLIYQARDDFLDVYLVR
jgi:hypothetical protein